MSSESDEQAELAADAQAGFDRRNVLTLSGAHFAHDCYPAFLGVLLPLLITRHGLSLALAGVIASGLRWTTSLQPFLGHIADRNDTRYWVIVTPATTALCMSLLGLAPNGAVILLLLLLTGVSHAAFHPAGGAMVTKVSGTRWGTGTSYFMTGGELGRVVGPLYIAAVVGVVGLERSWIALIPGLAASWVLYHRFKGAPGLSNARARPPRLRDVLREGRRPLMILSVLVVMRSFTNVGLLIFYPTFATGLGASLIVAGAAVAIYEIGGTLGTFVGGRLADRHGARRMLALGLGSATPPLIGAVMLGPTPAGLTLLGLGGLALLSASAIELVLMQRLLPDNRSAAVGITFVMKAAGATIAMISIGAIGDLVDLRTGLLVGIVVGLLALPVLWLITDERAEQHTQ